MELREEGERGCRWRRRSPVWVNNSSWKTARTRQPRGEIQGLLVYFFFFFFVRLANETDTISRQQSVPRTKLTALLLDFYLPAQMQQHQNILETGTSPVQPSPVSLDLITPWFARRGKLFTGEMAFTETFCYLIIKKGNKCSSLSWVLGIHRRGKLILLLCLLGTWGGGGSRDEGKSGGSN